MKIINLDKLGREELVDSYVVSVLLGISRRTVQDMASRRELPVYKIGRAVRFKVGEILDWREERKVGTV